VTTYHVIATREGDSWLADVSDVDGVHTWAKNLPGLDRNVREAIALADDLEDGAEAGLDLDYEYHTGSDELDYATASLRAARRHLARETNDLEHATVETARVLAGECGLSVRDVAGLLDISPQRVSQLVPGRVRKGFAERARRTRPVFDEVTAATVERWAKEA
jgi:hypothetical protein